MVFTIGFNQLRTAGIIGSIIFFISSLICIWRSSIELYFILKSFKPDEQHFMKLGFYISVTLNSILELLYFLSLAIVEKYTPLGYTAHICAYLAVVIAFSTSSYQWCAILFRPNERKKYILLLQVFIFINFVTAAIGVGVLFYFGSINKYTEKQNWAYVLSTTVNGGSLFILTCSLLIYGRVLAKRFAIDPNRTIPKAESKRKYQSLLRINTILGICCVCFFLRVGSVSIALSDSQGTKIEERHFPHVWWFLLSSWIPTIPVWTLLYTWRTKTIILTSAKASTTSSDLKQNRSSTLSSTEELNTPFISQHSVIQTSSYYQGFSDSESDGFHDSDLGNYQVTNQAYLERGLSTGFEDDVINREGSAYEAYFHHTRNLIDDRLSLE